MSKRYVHILWDGIFDSYKDPSFNEPMSLDEIVKVMNDTNNQIRIWKQKYDEMKAKYERCRDGKKEN